MFLLDIRSALQRSMIHTQTRDTCACFVNVLTFHAGGSVGEDVEKSEPSHTAGGNVNGTAALENSLA